MKFQFNGTKVDVYGTIAAVKSVQNRDIFTIDDGEHVTWSISPQPLPVYNQRMFSSPILQDGMHVLTMRVTVNQSETFIDYLEFIPSPSLPLLTTTVTLLQPGSTSSSISRGSPSSSSSHLSSAAVAGISIAGTAVVFSCLGILLWRCLNRRRQIMSTTAREGSGRLTMTMFSTPMHSTTPSFSSQSFSSRSGVSATIQTISRTAYRAIPKGGLPRYIVNNGWSGSSK